MQAYRGRKQATKNLVTPSQNKAERPVCPKIKFNISIDNLSCFIGEQRRKKLHPKFPSKPSSSSQHKFSSRNRKSRSKKPQSSRRTIPKTAVESVNIAIEASNTIISQIEDQGISCQWVEKSKEEEIAKTQGQNLGEVDQTQKQQSGVIENEELWGDCPLALTLGNSMSKSVQSFASTEDYYPYSVSYEYCQLPVLNTSTNISFDVQPNFIGSDPRTTLMVRNIPNKYTIKDLSEQIDIDHENTYDFLYLPYDQKNCCNVGYGFINFLNTEFLKQFYLNFNNTRWIKFRSEKICVLTYARLQGLNNLIEHFENSKVLNQRDKKYRPIIKEFSKIQHLVKSQQDRTT